MGRARLAARALGWACGGALIATPASAAPALAPFASLGTATTFAGAPAGDLHRVFVVQKSGAIRLFVDGTLQTAPFLDITSSVRSSENERGLLSMAFAGDYALSGRFYVYFTALTGNLEIWEYTRSLVSPNLAAPDSGRLIVSIPHPGQSNHNGGQLQWRDGRLWAGTGDGGG